MLTSYQACLAWLSEHFDMERLLGNADISAPSLDRMWTLMGLLGDPQDTVPAVHVTGTNGKGSTVRTAVEFFQASGLTVGSYTSPHLDAVNDRICLANEALSDADFTAAINEVATIEGLATERSGDRPSYFEVLAAAAYNWFANEAHVNLIEVGMGGRWDATNVIDSEVSVITNIGSEHLEIIGPTLEDVAFEKSGIIAEKSVVICGETKPELLNVISQAAKDAACELVLAGRDYRVEDRRVAVGGQVVDIVTPFERYEDVFIRLHGTHQAQNVATALAAVEAFFGRSLSTEVVEAAMERLQVPGRFEILNRSPVVVTDVAHNPLGAATTADTMREVFGDLDMTDTANTALVIGVSRPHDPAAMLEAIGAERYSQIVATAFDWPRSLSTSEIAAVAAQQGLRSVSQTATVAEAVGEATEAVGVDGLVLVTGSLYVVSEARAFLGITRR